MGIFSNGSGITTMEESFNFDIERGMLLSIFLCILYLAVMVFSIIGNGSVIISAIFERWKEVDSFTFVMFVSLAFNHLFISFVLCPIISYSMVAHHWGLGSLFCWWCALLSTYFYTVYIVHMVVLMFDIFVVRYSDLRPTISVSTSKRIAQNLWAICCLPQIYPLKWCDDPYLHDPIRGGCYQNFVFRDTSEFFKSFGVFLVLPVVLVLITYFVLLVKEEKNRRLTATILKKYTYGEKDLTITRNYITPLLAISIFWITTLPFLITGIVSFNSSISISPRLGEFTSTWFSLGGVFLPTLYFLAVKTYRTCILPNNKWDIHIAAITKLRRKKNLHSPCVRRQGIVMHNVPMMAISEEKDDGGAADLARLHVNTNPSNGTLNLTFDASPDLGMTVKTVRRELPVFRNDNFLTVSFPDH